MIRRYSAAYAENRHGHDEVFSRHGHGEVFPLLSGRSKYGLGGAGLVLGWAGAVTDFKLILQHLGPTTTGVNGAFDPHCSEYTQHTHFL